MLLHLPFYAYHWGMYYLEKSGADERAIEACKDSYTEKLRDFNVTFENVTVRVITASDFFSEMEVTGTAVYMDNGSIKKEQMSCRSGEYTG